MFTGLVEKTGTVGRLSRGEGLSIEIRPDSPWEDGFEYGESIAVDGVCLTVSRFGEGWFAADILDETARRSTLGSLIPGSRVNLERAMRAGGRFGGHVVQGHVDGTGEVLERIPAGRDFALKIKCGPVVSAGTVLKGSVAVNGVSLTVSDKGEGWFRTDITPSTAAHTTLSRLKPGDRVNLESDILSRYARGGAADSGQTVAQDAGSAAEGGLTMAKLAECGFF